MIYLDNAATTKVYEECNKIIEKYNSELFFNPSAMYSYGFNLHKEINTIKHNFITLLKGEKDGNVIFTSGATEANNLAIFGSLTKKQGTYLFSSGEHPSVYNCAVELKAKGYDVKFIGLNENGEVDFEHLKSLLNDQVCFVSLMLVSNETGAINPIKAVKQEMSLKCPTALLHVDCVQAFCKTSVNVKNMGIDLCTISAHKIYGPKGVGALYVSPRVNLKQNNFGGGQEGGLRSGTYNTSGIVAFNYAAQETFKNLETNYEHFSKLRECFINNLESIKTKYKINCQTGVPYILSMSFSGIRGETLVHMLEQDGVVIGTGSACSASKVGNRVLEEMGNSKDEILGSIRISFGINNTLDDVKAAAEKLVEYVKKLYAM